MIEYREMRLSDIDECLRLSRAAKWNQLDREWRQFLTLEPGSCRVAARADQIVGTVATIRYEDRLGWIGMMLVDEQERRQGIGKRLMNDALLLLQHQPSVGLDATPVGREVYLQLGFVDEYRLTRMTATLSESIELKTEARLRPMTREDLPAIAALDAGVFGSDRRRMLDWIFDGGPHYAWVTVSGEGIAGYCFGRTGYTFEHLGPVVAENRESAGALIAACMRNPEGRSFVLDVPEFDHDWRQDLTTLGFSELRPLYRMYRGGNLFPGTPEKQFAILGPEFG
jgi:GNAT superfamily N-acetyltransferase